VSGNKDTVMLDTDHRTYKQNNDGLSVLPLKLDSNSILQRRNPIHYASESLQKVNYSLHEKNEYKSKLNVIEEKSDKTSSGIDESTNVTDQQEKGKAISYSDLERISSE
jgi:hypothetical protein